MRSVVEGAISLRVTSLPRTSLPLPNDTLSSLLGLVSGRRVAVLTGAGCSTESGIPDYRGPETRRRARDPLKYQAFLREPEARRRYWARSVLGWPRIASARPNAAHHALARMQRTGAIHGLITQNVDRLHRAAGSDAIELHGALADVRCMDCGAMEDREALQRRLLELNPGWHTRHAELAPDGDADLPSEVVASFRVADCLACGGALKPHVVFFGENVPKERVEHAYAMVESADALLVVGSSLAVFSGFRFVKRAKERGLAVGIVNLGESRGDAHADVIVQARAGDALPWLADALDGR
jgi:NAD-dependent SIR2 family protein deacetylase